MWQKKHVYIWCDTFFFQRNKYRPNIKMPVNTPYCMCWSSCIYRHPAKPNTNVPSTSYTCTEAWRNIWCRGQQRVAFSFAFCWDFLYDFNILVFNLLGLLLCFLFDWILSNKLGALWWSLRHVFMYGNILVLLKLIEPCCQLYWY